MIDKILSLGCLFYVSLQNALKRGRLVWNTMD